MNHIIENNYSVKSSDSITEKYHIVKPSESDYLTHVVYQVRETRDWMRSYK